MSLRSRTMQPRDVRECAEIIVAHPAIGARYRHSIKDLSQAWLRLLDCEAKTALVLEELNGSKATICFVGVSIFASDDSRSRSFAAFENDFRLECSRIFLHIAESLEKQSATHTQHVDSVASLLNRIESSETKIEAEFSERERALLRLIRTIAELVDRLQTEVASEGLYDVPQISAAPLRPLESEGT